MLQLFCQQYCGTIQSADWSRNNTRARFGEFGYVNFRISNYGHLPYEKQQEMCLGIGADRISRNSEKTNAITSD